jgi:hypothetical protein
MGVLISVWSRYYSALLEAFSAEDWFRLSIGTGKLNPIFSMCYCLYCPYAAIGGVRRTQDDAQFNLGGLDLGPG